MNSRVIFYMSLLASMWCLSCTTPATAVEPAIALRESADSSVVLGAQTWQTLVESLASHPEVLTKDWTGVRRVLPVGCVQNPADRDLSCPPMAGVVRLSVDLGPTGIVDVVLKATANCDQIYTLMSHHFGKGSLDGGDKCNAEWGLNRWVKRARANVSRGRKDPSLLYLQFAVEHEP